MTDATAAPSARFFVTNDGTFRDRIRGCDTLIHNFRNIRQGPELVLLNDVLGWLNKLDEERVAAENRVVQLHARLDANAAEGAAEQMRRQWEDANNQLTQTREQLARVGAERDEANKAYRAAATEIASLAGAQRELTRLRGVHAAFVKGARSLLGEKANLLEAECDIPENLPPDAEEIANASRLPKSEVRGQRSGELPGETSAQQAASDMAADPSTSSGQVAEKLPEVEEDPATGVLTARVKRETLLFVLKLIKTHFDRFGQLQASLRMDPKAANLPRRAIFAGAVGATYGMAMMAIRSVADEIKAVLPAAPDGPLTDMMKAIVGVVGAFGCMPRK